MAGLYPVPAERTARQLPEPVKDSGPELFIYWLVYSVTFEKIRSIEPLVRIMPDFQRWERYFEVFPPSPAFLFFPGRTSEPPQNFIGVPPTSYNSQAQDCRSNCAAHKTN